MEINERQIVWIIDDELELATAYQEYLSDRYAPKVFGSVESALKEFDSGAELPDLIVSDLKMPKLSGLDFMRELRDRNQEIPAIMISGHADKTDVTEATRFEISGFLEKPFEPQTLENMIAHSLHVRKKAAQGKKLHYEYRALADELIGAYEMRYVDAENALYEHDIEHPATPEKKRLYIEGLSRQRRLCHDIESVRGKIDRLNQLG